MATMKLSEWLFAASSVWKGVLPNPALDQVANKSKEAENLEIENKMMRNAIANLLNSSHPYVNESGIISVSLGDWANFKSLAIDLGIE